MFGVASSYQTGLETAMKKVILSLMMLIHFVTNVIN